MATKRRGQKIPQAYENYVMNSIYMYTLIHHAHARFIILIYNMFDELVLHSRAKMSRIKFGVSRNETTIQREARSIGRCQDNLN